MEIASNRKLVLVIVGVTLLASSSCSSAEGKIAEAAVTQFHKQYNAGQFQEIYSQADEGFKKSHNETDFVAILEALRHKLGTVNQSSPRGSRGNATTLGEMVTLSCDIEFAKGKGTEKFIFLISGENATLFDYSVDSPQF